MRAWCRAERLTRVWSARHAPHRRGEARLEVTRVPIAFHRHIIQCGKRGGEEYAPWVKGGGGAHRIRNKKDRSLSEEHYENNGDSAD